jgi:hypothetical protein
VSTSDVDEVLARLVAQFASPYDFLREVVQNAMDAGSDRVDVLLHVHEAGDAVVYELEIADAGEGMDESIIDGELTKLFASTKTGDRTQAGGFGIGFVSVFAWEPQCVLLHTARAGETWELVFHADRRFEKHRVDAPFEGTTVRLFRRGSADEREGIADSVRQSLWRWCRFVPLDVTFEDVEGGHGPEPIRDTPPSDDEALVAVHEQGGTRVRVAFAVPPHAVLLRNGLVLGEGLPSEEMPALARTLGDSLEHLRVWADSPLLRTDLARDRVVDDEGRKAIEAIALRLVLDLRAELVARIEALASTLGPWSAELHATYSHLHAHLACERTAAAARLNDRALVRLSGGGAGSPAALVRRATSGLVLACDPGPADGDALVLQAAAAQAGMPTVAATTDDRAWLAPLLAGVEVRALGDAVARVEPASASVASLCALVGQVLVRADLPVAWVRLGRWLDGPPVHAWGIEVHASPCIVGLALPRTPSGSALGVWLDERHVLVAAAIRHAAIDPLHAATALALVVARGWAKPVDLDDFADAVDAVRAA